MNNENIVLNMLLHLGHKQLEDGLFHDAFSTFTAAHSLDANDERVLRGRDLANAQLLQSV